MRILQRLSCKSFLHSLILQESYDVKKLYYNFITEETAWNKLMLLLKINLKNTSGLIKVREEAQEL